MQKFIKVAQHNSGNQNSGWANGNGYREGDAPEQNLNHAKALGLEIEVSHNKTVCYYGFYLLNNATKEIALLLFKIGWGAVPRLAVNKGCIVASLDCINERIADIEKLNYLLSTGVELSELLKGSLYPKDDYLVLLNKVLKSISKGGTYTFPKSPFSWGLGIDYSEYKAVLLGNN